MIEKLAEKLVVLLSVMTMPLAGCRVKTGIDEMKNAIAKAPEIIPDTEETDAGVWCETDAYWDWASSYLEKCQASKEASASLRGYVRSLLPELLTDESESTVVSPLNIWFALAMCAEVTDGKTREEILHLLGTADLAETEAFAGKLWAGNTAENPVLKSLLADSLWLRDDLSYNRETMQKLADTYHADFYAVSMGSEKGNDLLHQWLNEHTGNLLKDAVQGENFSEQAVLALASALYYKANFTEGFEESETKEDIFHGTDGDSQVSMMHQMQTMNYYAEEGYTAVNLSLQDSGSMWFILPEDGEDPSVLLKKDEIYAMLEDPYGTSYERAFVDLYVPKIDVSAKTDLIGGLQALGITDLFDPDLADFTPMTDVKNVAVTSASHAARVRMDENGVEGAAYTVMMMEATGAFEEPREVEFRADRPFLFAITGQDGSILFAGIMRN